MSGLGRDNWDWNPDTGVVEPAPTTRNDFRQQEIRDLNTTAADEERSKKMVMWGLAGLAITIVLEMLLNHSTNRSSRR